MVRIDEAIRRAPGGVAGDAEDPGGADEVAGEFEGSDTQAALGGLEVPVFEDDLRHATELGRSA